MKDKGELISSTNSFAGKFLSVRTDKFRMPDGKISDMEILEHPGAVGILAIDDNDNVILVKQYRPAIDKFVLEIPAGTIEVGEDPLECAKRELLEETGYIATDWQRIVGYYSSVGFCNEHIQLFMARGLTYEGVSPDDEITEVINYHISEFVSANFTKSNIVDGKTLICILTLASMLMCDLY